MDGAVTVDTGDLFGYLTEVTEQYLPYTPPRFKGVDYFIKVQGSQVPALNTKFHLTIKVMINVAEESFATSNLVSFQEGQTSGCSLEISDGSLFWSVTSLDQNSRAILSTSIEADTWYFVVAMFDFTQKKASLYLNGKFIVESEALESLTELATAGDLHIGTIVDPFHGFITGLDVFNTPITAEQVMIDYEQGYKAG